MKKKLSILIALVMAISLCLVPAMTLAAEVPPGMVTLIDPVNATITRTDTLDEVTFHIEILSENVPHDVYGVAIAFATSLDQPAFHVTYQENLGPEADWYYIDYGVDGWADSIRGTELILEQTGIIATGQGYPAPGEKVFTVDIPIDLLGGPGATYYYAIQVRTNCIGWYPAAYDWGANVSGFAEATVMTPPTKADILKDSGVPGKGLEEAPGLQKPFNPNSQASNNAGKK